MPSHDKPPAVLVTGAGGGIGVATTRALVDKGFRVYAAARSATGPLDGLAGVHPLTMDVTDRAAIAAAAAEIRARGDHSLRGVVNNAGIIVQGPMEQVPEADLRRQFEVNVIGAALVTQAFVPFLRPAKGTLVNITAGTARAAGPFYGPISASKAAVASLSDAMRLELAHWGISVVVVEPGAMDTAIFAKAGEVAEKANASLPPDQLALYQAQQGAVLAGMAGLKLSSPALVADVIAKVMTTGKPKPRYTVGPDLRLLGLLSRLPLRTRDRLIKSVTGLGKVPAAQ
ncbi:SDR family NAD(P)-dependent oxidoreductase [Streptomyces sp. NBC_00448]|uniref:SDR family NAD(P)-dependent oxidoreductase n=1 Tax=Streptomyces sp. NBC_00448 TaxID=2903652 RepID=UPI002E21054D